MDPKLIAAAAKLCGWERRDNRWLADGRVWMTNLDRIPEELTDAGLLALEAVLKERDWYWKAGFKDNWIWTRWDPRLTAPSKNVSHEDRATAACLAAQQEAGDA